MLDKYNLKIELKGTSNTIMKKSKQTRGVFESFLNVSTSHKYIN
jgi:hypothetical protein